MLNFHFDELMEICEDKGGYYKVAKATVIVRKGIMLNDDALIKEGITMLEETGKDEIVKMLLQEVKDYK